VEIRCDPKGNRTIVHISGEVDMHQSPELEKILSKLTDQKVSEILVNLSQTTYLDSSGIATLVECFRKVKVYGGKFCLVELNEKILPIFEIMRLDKVFTICSTMAEVQ